MKTYLIIFCFFISSLQFAQPVWTIASDKAQKPPGKLLGLNAGSRFTLWQDRNKKHILQTDSFNKVIMSADYSTYVEGSKKFIYRSSFFVKQQPAIIFEQQDGLELNLVLMLLEPFTLKPKGEMKTIFTLPKTTESSNRSGEQMPYLFTLVSPNGQFVLISFELQGRRKFLLYNSDLVLQWTLNDAANTKGKIEDMKLADDGSVYFLSPYMNGTNMSFILGKMKDGSVTKSVLENESFSLSFAAIGFTPSGRPFVSGVYSLVLTADYFFENIGVFIFMMDQQTTKGIFYPFSENLVSAKKKKLLNPFSSVIINGSKAEYFGLTGQIKPTVYVSDNGVIYLVAEEMIYADGSTLQGGLQIFTRHGNIFLFMLFSTGPYITDYRNVVVTSFDTLGLKLGQGELLKDQEPGDFASTFGWATKDGLYLFYNESEENVTRFLANKSKRSKLVNYSGSYLVCAQFSTACALRFNKVFEKTNYAAQIQGCLNTKNTLHLYLHGPKYAYDASVTKGQ